MKHQQITVPFNVKETSEDDTYFFFSGYASTFDNIDFGGDKIVKGAFLKTISKNRNIPILWQHDRHEPIGVYEELKEDDHGLFVRGKMPKDDTFVAGRVIPQMKVGSITKMSIGYSATDVEYNKDVRMLKEVELFEASLVTFPMNDKAEITALKSIDKTFIENSVSNIREAEAILKEVGFSQTAAKAFIGIVKKTDDEHKLIEAWANALK